MRGVRYGEYGSWVVLCSDIDAIGRYVNQLIGSSIDHIAWGYFRRHSFIHHSVYIQRPCVYRRVDGLPSMGALSSGTQVI